MLSLRSGDSAVSMGRFQPGGGPSAPRGRATRGEGVAGVLGPTPRSVTLP